MDGRDREGFIYVPTIGTLGIYGYNVLKFATNFGLVEKLLG
jgi:hypothetical protein